MPAADPSRFDLPGDGPAAVLCLHGLTGTPYEVRPLGEALSRQGLRAVGPVLPGHNATPEQLARTRHTDWLDAASGELRALRARHERVCVLGLSMGALLSLVLASEHPVAGVVSIAAPLRLRHPIMRLIPVLKVVLPMWKKRGGPDIRDDAARARHPGYDRMPLRSVHELQRLQQRVRAGLSDITAPILVAHGARDRTANPADAEVIHASVSSSERELCVFEESAHVLPVDVDGPRLAEAVCKFVGRHAR
ncbi:MAG: alpha/beta hydrolase [Myxococcota bacterium]